MSAAVKEISTDTHNQVADTGDKDKYGIVTFLEM